MLKHSLLTVSLLSGIACGVASRDGSSPASILSGSLSSDTTTPTGNASNDANVSTGAITTSVTDTNVASSPNQAVSSDPDAANNPNAATFGTNPNSINPNSVTDANTRAVNANGLILACSGIPPCLVQSESSFGYIGSAGAVVDVSGLATPPAQVQAALIRDRDGAVVARAAANNGGAVVLPELVPLPVSVGAPVDSYTVYAWNTDEVGADFAPVVRYASLQGLVSFGQQDNVVSWVKMRNAQGVLTGVAVKLDFNRMSVSSPPPSVVGQGRRNSYSVLLCEVPTIGPGPGSSGLYGTPTAMIVTDNATGEHVFTDIYADAGYRTSDDMCNQGIFANNVMEIGHTYTIELYAQNGVNAWLSTSGSDDLPLSKIVQQAQGDILIYSQPASGNAYVPQFGP